MTRHENDTPPEPTLFELAMREAVRRHNAGEYEHALEVRQEAFHSVDPMSVEAGRAARDIGASHDRLGRPDEAKIWAHVAYDIHNLRVQAGETEVRRERAASSMYVGSLALRQAMSSERAGLHDVATQESAIIFLRDANRDLDYSEQDGRPDQFRVNLLGRRAMAEALYGDLGQAATLSLSAIKLGAISESPRLVAHANTDMTSKERWKVRVKGVARGIAALGVTALVRPRRQWAAGLANRAL